MSTSVEEFRQTYIRLCKDHHIDVQDDVLSQFASSQKTGRKAGYCLDLSTSSLSVKTCAMLGKVIASDRTFSEIKMNDCMMVEEAVRAITHGMTVNVSCRKLDLKGNNIRGTAAEALGRMLKQNAHLLSLCLEWNAMGMLENSLGVFCEGLAFNSRLQILDLRSNQISHDGASEIATALKRNNVLRALDLRWNNIGLLGGRALLNALDSNKTLVKLELSGNNIPNDILRAIETAVIHNADRESITTELSSRTHMMSREIQQIRQDRQSEVVSLLDKLDRQDEAMRKSNRSTQQRIDQLQEALEERKSQFNTLVTKLSMAESELAMSEAKITELNTLLQRAREEKCDTEKQHQQELRNDRENRASLETKLNRELIDLAEKNTQLENKRDELERKGRLQQDQIYELKEQVTILQAENKLKASHYEERIHIEKQKTKDAYKDADNMKEKDVERIRRECDDLEKSLRDKIQKLEMQRIELEEDVSRQKSNITSERVQHEEQLMMVKQKLKNEEEQRCRQLDDKVRLLQTAKDEMQSHSSQLSGTISDLQIKNSNLVLENETLKRKIEDLNQELAGKNNEMMEEVGKVRIELNQKISKLETEKMSQAELYDKISKQEKQLEVCEGKCKSLAEAKERQVGDLREQLQKREDEISRMQQDDAQRSAMLQSAFMNYVSKSPYSPR